MIVPGHAHAVMPGEGRTVDLGVVKMRVLAAGETTGRAFTLAEFFGDGEGAWTVPHIHRGMEESFFVLEGSFTFSVGDRVDRGDVRHVHPGPSRHSSHDLRGEGWR